MDGNKPENNDELRDDVAALRREVADLRQAEAQHAAVPPRRTGQALRWIAAVALLLIGSLLGGASIAAVFLRDQVLDTSEYVANVAPLARDPDVQAAITNRVTNEVMSAAQVGSLINQGIAALQQAGAPPVLSQLSGTIDDAVRSFVSDQVGSFVSSDRFAQLWDSVNRTAHDEIEAVLTTGEGTLLSVDGDKIQIDLKPVLDAAKQRISDAGLTIVNQIPSVSVQYTIYESSNLPKIRSAVQLLDYTARWLPFVALLVLAGGVLVAPQRRRGLIVTASLTGAVLLLMLVGLALVREYYLSDLPSSIQSPAAARTVYDTLLRFLVATLWAFLAVAAIVLVAALLAGPSRPARWIRRQFARLLDLTGRGLGRLENRTNVRADSVNRFCGRYRTVIQVIAVVLAAGALLLIGASVAAALWLTAALLAVLALVEVLARTPPAQAVVPRGGTTSA